MSQITKQEIETLLSSKHISISEAEDVFQMDGVNNLLYDILISVGWESSQKDK